MPLHTAVGAFAAAVREPTLRALGRTMAKKDADQVLVYFARAACWRWKSKSCFPRQLDVDHGALLLLDCSEATRDHLHGQGQGRKWVVLGTAHDMLIGTDQTRT